MKSLQISAMAACCMLSACEARQTAEPSSAQNLYFGQQPPGMRAEIFAPGLVSTDDLQVLPALAPDLSEFYFFEQSGEGAPGYRVLGERGGRWVSWPLETTQGPGEVFISTDNTRMYLGAEYRERARDGWSELQSLGAPFTDYEIMRLTVSDAGTYVFDERDEFGVLRYSRVIDGERQPPQPFGGDINAGRWTAHPFIAPDESFLIFDSNREDGYGDEDLYVSFREPDGDWGEAINLGDAVNSEHDDIFGAVSPDGRYLFFSRINLEGPQANIMWVDASVLHDLRPEAGGPDAGAE